MASKLSSLFAFVLITTILLATTWQAVARRHTKLKNSYKGDKKEPQFLFPSDGYIPGFGRLGFPPFFGFTPQNPNIGGGGGGGEVEPAPVSGGGNGLQVPPVSGGGYVPGGDDTFVPNPGFEVPSPRKGAGVPVPVNP
ncbi:hypothetical protein LR48_Vigan05g151000 [Vigna angularis]|uniref:Cell wall protein n=2 Tax=Phaseolus angularis TaxID=3914 RepID=A0A0S3SHH9_PHAAN|nr:putative cell wall protein [Vigna angularis]KAG2371697.1 putative cell wall protein [Vigna angularis]KOM43905.1 hypothetical protein LR48_Vigan05g151000 [Vigna angularis]BAT92264.1 hypothetical protein VIGAN_07095100 [Vigna angularis var. angularis]